VSWDGFYKKAKPLHCYLKGIDSNGNFPFNLRHIDKSNGKNRSTWKARKTYLLKKEK
jgi:hypothetical protein